MALSGHASGPTDVRFRVQTGHDELELPCPLMTKADFARLTHR
jgi:hypothetical protein